MEWRLIQDGYHDAYANMAIDEALLQSNIPVLRFYRWLPPAISIGYFQKLEEEINLEECKRWGIDYVRRITGGKAVLHDKELTYSFVISQELMPKSIIESYKVISRAILIALGNLGLEAEMSPVRSNPAPLSQDRSEYKKVRGAPTLSGTSNGVSEKVNPVGDPRQRRGKRLRRLISNGVKRTQKSPLCFNDPSYYEIVANGKKIVGSAQVRKNGKLLQHGSILLDFDIEKMRSLFKISSPAFQVKERVTSLNQELKRKVEFKDVATALKKSFEENFNIKLIPDGLTRKERTLAQEIAATKFSTKEWNYLR